MRKPSKVIYVILTADGCFYRMYTSLKEAKDNTFSGDTVWKYQRVDDTPLFERP